MGLIRKTLAVGTVGIVSGSSKKQRTAKATMRATQSIEAMLREATAEAVAVRTSRPPREVYERTLVSLATMIEDPATSDETRAVLRADAERIERELV